MRPSRFLPVLLLAVATLLVPLEVRAQAAERHAPARLNGTTSDAARAEFLKGILDVQNVFATRAVGHFDRALQLDPAYGLARVIRAANASGLSEEERKAELDRGLADAAAGPTWEVLAALSWRTEDPQERRILLQALTQLVADNASAPAGAETAPASFAYRLAATETDNQARIAAFRGVTSRFPDFAAAHNELGYTLWRTGDHEGGMREIQEYVRLLPDHPNSHDSYAELLQWSKRYNEALQHYQGAIQKDASYSEAYAGLAEVYLLQGKPADARAAWQQAIEHAPAMDAANHTIAMAAADVAEGKPDKAVATLGRATKLAQQNHQTGRAAQSHAYTGIVVAGSGRAAAAATRLDEAIKMAPEDFNTQALAAIGYALAGKLDAARAQADKVSTTAANGTANQKDVARRVSAAIAAQGNDVAAAQEALRAPLPDVALAQELLAEALKRAGRRADAQALKAQVLESTDVTLLGAVARMRAKKL